MTREEVAHNNPQVIVLDGFGDNVTMFDSAILGLSTDGRVV